MSIPTASVPQPILPPIPVRNPNRFRLHRAGIHNVWQYDDQVFRFGDGRLLLRGKNGAGKSKALEVLLPYLLDGESRRLDSTGAGKTTLKWLMLDGVSTTNRLGYLWLEFARDDDRAQRHWLTIGAAIKASKATDEAKAVFFVTPLRVGEDLHLIKDRQPLAIDRLREVVGFGNVYDRSGEYRSRVMRDLFGLTDASRYRNLLHLLHRLRRPTIGDRIESGELATVLTEALPPLDDDILDRVAHNLDDLESVRLQLGRLEQVDRALLHFVKHYRGYLHGVFRTRIAAVRGEIATLTDLRRMTGSAEREVVRLLHEERGHQAEASGLEQRRDRVTGELRGLRDSHAYQGMEQLRDRRATVAAMVLATKSSWSGVTLATNAHRAAGERVAAHLQRVDDDTAVLRATLRDLSRDARDCGVAEALLGRPRTVTRVTLAPTTTWTATDVEGQEHKIASDPVTSCDPTLELELQAWFEELGEAVRAVHLRRRIADDLDRRLTKLTLLEAKVDRLEGDRERIDGEVEAAIEDVEVAFDLLVDESLRYEHSVLAWAEGPSRLGVDLAEVSAVVAVPSDGSLPAADRALSANTPHDVAQAAHSALEPALTAVEQSRDHAIAEQGAVRDEIASVRRELRHWQELSDPEPPASPYSSAVRGPGTGVPLYLAVDFADDMSTDEQAGLEAALQASGLLSAWLRADGTIVEPDTQDVLVQAGAPVVGGRALTAMLRPAEVLPVGVSAEAVSGVLAAIGVGGPGTQPPEHVESWVTVDGRWRLGVLRGAWTKQRVQYLGAASRALTRATRITELEERLDVLETELSAKTAAVEKSEHARSVLRKAERTVPPGRELTRCWTVVEQRQAAVTKLTAALSTVRAAAERARAESGVARRDAESAASADRLPFDAHHLTDLRNRLNALAAALERFRSDVERVRRTSAEQRAEEGSWRQAAADRDEARDRYTDLYTRLTAARAELDTLEKVIGSQEADLLAAEARAERELDDIGRTLPGVLARARATRDDLVRARAARDGLVQRLREQEQSVMGVGASLRAPLADSGLLVAAGFTDVEPMLDVFDAAPADDVRAKANALRVLVDRISEYLGPEKDDLGDTAILRRHDELRDDLSGGYDVAATEDRGIKRFDLRDDSGSHDIALVQQRIRGEVERARLRLSDREQETFERYLLGELGDHLGRQVMAAEALVKEMNSTLKDVRTSHGLGASLVWQLPDDTEADIRSAVRLLRGAAAMRSKEDSALLRQVLQRQIESVRLEDPSAGYSQHLRVALDYRRWFEFDVLVTDVAKPTSRRKLTHRTALSQGEQRVMSYLVLFATAAAHFTSLKQVAPTAPRVILLDDAFAKVDEPTHGRLLGLLVHLDLDFVLTSERLWGCFPTVPSIHIYECLRDPRNRGVATVHFTWDGRQKRLVTV